MEREQAAPDAAGRDLPLGVPRLWRADAGNIELDRDEMMRYLGYRGQAIDAELARRIDGVVEGLGEFAAPAGVWAVFPVAREGGRGARAGSGRPCIRLEGTALELTGRSIWRHLKDARYAAVLACTLGMQAEQRLRVLSSQSPLEGAVFDAACSAFVEATANALNRDIAAAAAAAGLSCNWRFSPGYGDLPLTGQPTLLAALNASRLCGITATPTDLLMPTKSITALIGLFDGAVSAADTVRSCAGCRVASGCSFRAGGTHCWG